MSRTISTRLTIPRWPVIAAIIVGALIVLSVLWCVFSCLCCGISLCTACGKCLTCGNCCGACGSSRGRKRDAEYQAMPPTPTPYQGYQPQPGPMMYANNGPQFATFDASNKRSANIHEDSLPAMPSWDTATTRRVEDNTPVPRQQQQRPRSDMEMERMLPQGQGQGPYSPAHESPYTSDLGAQNQSTRGGYHNDYYDTPMSPAPTYYSIQPAAGPSAAGARAMSPPSRALSPQQHGTNFYAANNSPAPYPSSRESTQFGSGYTSSPYHQQQASTTYSYEDSTSYNHQRESTSYDQPQDSGVRPPSLLQIGRKPVAGTYREV